MTTDVWHSDTTFRGDSALPKPGLISRSLDVADASDVHLLATPDARISTRWGGGGRRFLDSAHGVNAANWPLPDDLPKGGSVRGIGPVGQSKRV